MNAIAPASTTSVSRPELDSRRILAGLIDMLVVIGGAFVIGLLAGALVGGRPPVGGQLGVIVLGWALYYYFACESSGGQTIGKKAVRLRVVRTDGRPAGMGEIAVRTILRVIDGIAFYLVGYVVMRVTGRRRQRLGDLAGGTIVTAADAPVEQGPVAEPATPARPSPSPTASETITLPTRPAGAPVEAMSAVEEPVVEAPAIEERVVEEPIVEAPAIEGPVVENPAVEEPVVGEPVVEEPVVEPPAAAQEDPVTVKSVETVSAIDLIMGGSEEEEDSSQQDPPAVHS
jgi:uncharacterized RDD family membrane protein YckC